MLYAIKIWRRLAPVWTRGKHLPRVAYRKALDQLGEAGLVREYGETRTAFATRIAQVVPSLVQLAALSEAARLGNPAVSPRPELDRAAWMAAGKAVAADLRKHVPLPRRMAGLLNPVIFWQIR